LRPPLFPPKHRRFDHRRTLRGSRYQDHASSSISPRNVHLREQLAALTGDIDKLTNSHERYHDDPHHRHEHSGYLWNTRNAQIQAPRLKQPKRPQKPINRLRRSPANSWSMELNYYGIPSADDSPPRGALRVGAQGHQPKLHSRSLTITGGTYGNVLVGLEVTDSLPMPKLTGVFSAKENITLGALSVRDRPFQSAKPNTAGVPTM
jgi:hypothetical protein